MLDLLHATCLTRMVLEVLKRCLSCQHLTCTACCTLQAQVLQAQPPQSAVSQAVLDRLSQIEQQLQGGVVSPSSSEDKVEMSEVLQAMQVCSSCSRCTSCLSASGVGFCNTCFQRHCQCCQQDVGMVYYSTNCLLEMVIATRATKKSRLHCQLAPQCVGSKHMHALVVFACKSYALSLQ